MNTTDRHALFAPAVPTIIEDGCFKLILENRTYDIEFHRIRSAAALAGWIHHLLSKGWMDAYSLKRFIEVVARHHKIDIYSEK